MREKRLWRATYDAERDSWVVEDAGFVEGEPVLEYRFSFLEDDEVGENVGGIEKWWIDDGDTLATGEFHVFGEYVDEAEFKLDVQCILAEAKQHAEEENLDAFLAVIDIVKNRIYEMDEDDESILFGEGLFEDGIEDAYSWREDLDDDRLHDHVERPDEECWHLHVGLIADPEGVPLGWGVFAVWYPDLPLDATYEAMQAAERARILDLEHWNEHGDALIRQDGIERFMENAREEEPDFAFVNDSQVLEWMSVQCSDEEQTFVEWDVLEGEALRQFLSGVAPTVREREHWHPHPVDLATDFAQALGIDPHIADQVHAIMLGDRAEEVIEPGSVWDVDDEEE